MQTTRSIGSLFALALAGASLLGGCYGRAYYGGGYYYRARPAVYVQPRPVYVAPQPVYVAPRPAVYVAPPRPAVYVAPPAPPTVYVQPPSVQGTVYVR